MFAFGRLAGRAGGGGDRECGIPDDHQAEFQEEAKLRPVFDALTKLGFKRRCGGTKSTRRAVVFHDQRMRSGRSDYSWRRSRSTSGSER